MRAAAHDGDSPKTGFIGGSGLNVDELSLAIQQELQAEATDALREVRVMVVGVGADAGLERVVEYLGRFEVPVSVVSFRVFERKDGPHLLIREVTEEQAEPQRPQSQYSIDPILHRANQVGVGEEFERFVTMSEEVGFRVQPRKYAVRIAAPQDGRYRLMYARPENDGLAVGVSPDKFAEFFAPLTEDAVAEAVGMDDDGVPKAGVDLDMRLNRIQVFLRENQDKLMEDTDEDGDGE